MTYFIKKDGKYLHSSFSGQESWTDEPQTTGVAYSDNPEDLKPWAESLGAEVVQQPAQTQPK